MHASEVFDRANVYQLPPESAEEGGKLADMPRHLQGRRLFDPAATCSEITRRFEQGATVKRTGLTDEFGFEDFLEHYREQALPLFAVSSNGAVTVLQAQGKVPVKRGQTLISLVFNSDGVPDTAEKE